jgi:hypothetical protein
MKIQSEKDLIRIGQEYSQNLYHPKTIKVNIGMASCGIAAGARASYDKAVETFKDDATMEIRQTGCIGFCEVEPLVEILSD